jgi:hypothetical protein
MGIIQEIKGYFDEIYFIHVYRDLNHTENTLSKEALLVQEGVLIEHRSRIIPIRKLSKKLFFEG